MSSYLIIAAYGTSYLQKVCVVINTNSHALIYLSIEGVKRTALDIATFDWEETASEWKSLMRKHFWRFLPNMSNCEITKRHAYNEIQEWFEMAYLGWQFHTPESNPRVVRLTTKVISMLYSSALLIYLYTL